MQDSADAASSSREGSSVDTGDSDNESRSVSSDDKITGLDMDSMKRAKIVWPLLPG
jgi:hypothetical protein